MPDRKLVADHYTHGSLIDALLQGIQQLGKSPQSIEIEDLAAVDEFHIGGCMVIESFFNQLDIDASHHILDVGCGIGGAARFAATKYGCRVTGVDLTREFVEAGNTICSWLGLEGSVRLEQEDATQLTCSADTFDRAYLLHVGMNIADKHGVAKELYRVTRPGGKIGIYDVMQVGDGELAYPVPWAATSQGSSLAPLETYRSALEDAGFQVAGERNRREFALEFFEQLQAKAVSREGPPPLGLHILMGSTADVKIGNMIENISRNLIAPIEIVAEKLA